MPRLLITATCLTALAVGWTLILHPATAKAPAATPGHDLPPTHATTTPIRDRVSTRLQTASAARVVDHESVSTHKTHQY